MKILLLSRFPLKRDLGSPKMLLMLADEFRELGHTCEVFGPNCFLTDREYSSEWRTILKERARDFDIVEFEHDLHPFDRQDYPSETRFVVRVQILLHHLAEVRFPEPSSLRRAVRRRARKLIFGLRDTILLRQKISHANRTLKNVDHIIVLNKHDRERLIQEGIPDVRLSVIPNGLPLRRLEELSQVQHQDTASGIVFIGTFDYRKGAADLPKIFSAIKREVPHARLRLLGTQGMIRDEAGVRKFFSVDQQGSIDVFPKFEEHELPGYLADSAIGIFPSYLESFGLGILEMLAAGIPVIAYDCPGPSMMLPEEFLVKPGDYVELARRAVRLLENRQLLKERRTWALARAGEFDLHRIAQETVKVYELVIIQR